MLPEAQKQPEVSVENIEQPPDKYMKNTYYNIGANQEGLKQQTKDKRVAMEKDTLSREIFKLFKEQTDYTLEEVCSILQQPRDPVKKMLDDMCDFNR